MGFERLNYYEHKIDDICQIDPLLKRPVVLLQLGLALTRAKHDLGEVYFDLRDSLFCLRHQHDRHQVTVDKDLRLMEFAGIRACWVHHIQIPHLGWSICREFSCLCPKGDEKFLINLFQTGAIRPSMTREQLSALRSLMRDTLIAPRH